VNELYCIKPKQHKHFAKLKKQAIISGDPKLVRQTTAEVDNFRHKSAKSLQVGMPHTCHNLATSCTIDSLA